MVSDETEGAESESAADGEGEGEVASLEAARLSADALREALFPLAFALLPALVPVPSTAESSESTGVAMDSESDGGIVGVGVGDASIGARTSAGVSSTAPKSLMNSDVTAGFAPRKGPTTYLPARGSTNSNYRCGSRFGGDL
jgi:hypothetical protein